MTLWKEVKRRGVLSPEQPDFKERRLKAVKRRHRAWLRAQVAEDLSGDGGTVGDGFDELFD